MRKEVTITLEDGGQEKRFIIKQFPATKSEMFKFKFGLLVGNADLGDLQHAKSPYDIISFFLGALSDKPYERIQDMLNMMISCVSRVHDGGITTQLTPENIDSYVEEGDTLMRLRGEVLKVNGFFHGSGQDDSNNSEKSPAPEITIKRQK